MYYDWSLRISVPSFLSPLVYEAVLNGSWTPVWVRLKKDISTGTVPIGAHHTVNNVAMTTQGACAPTSALYIARACVGSKVPVR